MITYKWIGGGYLHPKVWAFKKDMPAHLRAEAVRVDFGLFGVGFIHREQFTRTALMKDGQRMALFDFILRTPGRVIGPCDMSAADAYAWAEEWRSAMSDKRLGR
jgi:hypothetical protein